MGKIHWVSNSFKTSDLDQKAFSSLDPKTMDQVMHFHTSLPQYQKTPLHSLKDLSKFLGVKDTFVKDESQRFGLKAFKGLGVSYAVASYFAKALSLDLNTTSFTELVDRVKTLPKSTFATATDGNHGKSVAWAARLFGQNANIYLPKGASPVRIQAIEKLGANVRMTDRNYDDTVEMVANLAKEHRWILFQDTSWEGYEDVPLWIMQGYLTIMGEILEQMKTESFHQITHVILQAGVGTFPASMVAMISQLFSHARPKIIIVEPSQAACFYQSAVQATGSPQRVYGDLSTIMAGLGCGEPNPRAWKILKPLTDYFVSCEDSVTKKGMRILGNPIGQDPKVISGESGAVPLGLLYELMRESSLVEAKQAFGLDENSKILIISTEGDTDPVNYRKIVWEALD